MRRNIALLLIISLLPLNCPALTIIAKVGNASTADPNSNEFKQSWRDGQIIEIEPDSYIAPGKMKNYAVITLKDDFADFIKVKPEIDRYWEHPNRKHQRNRKRDYYISYEELLKDKIITEEQYKNILSKEVDDRIKLDMTFDEFEPYLHYEDDNYSFRSLDSYTRYGTISSAGTYTIGDPAAVATDYRDIGHFESDLPADATGIAGTIIGEFHYAGETNTDGTDIVFNTKTDADSAIKITVDDTYYHQGVYGEDGNKCWIDLGTYDSITLDDDGTDSYYNYEFEKLQFDISGDWNSAFLGDFANCTTGLCKINRIIIKGDALVDDGIRISCPNDSAELRLTNIVLFDLTADTAIKLSSDTTAEDGTAYLYNITVHNCDISYETDSSLGTLLARNNISQSAGTSDFNDASDFDTFEYNIGETSVAEMTDGATVADSGTTDGADTNKLIDSDQNFLSTVDVGYVIKNTTDTTYTYVTAVDSNGQLTVNDDIFADTEGYAIYKNYFGPVTFADEAGDDFRLGSGDTLAKDNGVDLSGTLTDDIDGTTRPQNSVFDIGADELVQAAAGGSKVIMIMF